MATVYMIIMKALSDHVRGYVMEGVPPHTSGRLVKIHYCQQVKGARRVRDYRAGLPGAHLPVTRSAPNRATAWLTHPVCLKNNH